MQHVLTASAHSHVADELKTAATKVIQDMKDTASRGRTAPSQVVTIFLHFIREKTLLREYPETDHIFQHPLLSREWGNVQTYNCVRTFMGLMENFQGTHKC